MSTQATQDAKESEGSIKCGFIGQDQFQEACSDFSESYQALSPTIRMRFELSGKRNHQYISIFRPFVVAKKVAVEDHCHVSLCALDDMEEDEVLEDIEGPDEAALHHGRAADQLSNVEYSVLYSTSYQVPILYIQSHHLPSTTSKTLDFLYQALVPTEARGTIRNDGVMGGISMANHPTTGIPAYFLHPCNTAEAMGEIIDGRSVSPLEYLQLWFGLVASPVGLYLPKELVIEPVKSR